MPALDSRLEAAFTRRQTALWLTVLALFAALLRCLHLGHKGIWADEAFSVALAELPWPRFLHTLTSSEANMSLYYVLLRGWVHLGDSPWWVRGLSVLAGVATVPAIYFAGRVLFSQRAGLIAALLLSFNVFHIDYSQEARSYSLAVLLVTCSGLFFVRSIRSDSRGDSGWYIATSAAALYAHFFAGLVLAAQFVAWIFLPRERRSWTPLRNLIAVAALGLPLLLFLAFRRGAQLDWVQHPTAKEVYHLFTYFSGSGVKFAIFVLAMALAGWEWLRRRGRGEAAEAWSFVFVVSWLLLPIAATVFVSHWKPIFFARFLLICLPAALLLFAQGLATIGNRCLRFAAVAVVTIASLAALRSYYRQPGPENWDASISYLAQNARAGDVVIFTNPYCRFPFDYNLRRSGIQLSPMQIEPNDARGAGTSLAQAKSVWVFCGVGLASENVRSAENSGFRLRQTKRFAGADLQEYELDVPTQPGNH